MAKILLSIKPQYVDKIFSGEKRFEFRKFHCKNDVDTIVIYATSPVKAVVGEVELIDVIEGDIEQVWQETNEFAGISQSAYDKYYDKRQIAVAYKLGNVCEYKEPKKLIDFGLHYVPRSFAYL